MITFLMKLENNVLLKIENFIIESSKTFKLKIYCGGKKKKVQIIHYNNILTLHTDDWMINEPYMMKESLTWLDFFSRYNRNTQECNIFPHNVSYLPKFSQHISLFFLEIFCFLVRFVYHFRAFLIIFVHICALSHCNAYKFHHISYTMQELY